MLFQDKFYFVHDKFLFSDFNFLQLPFSVVMPLGFLYKAFGCFLYAIGIPSGCFWEWEHKFEWGAREGAQVGAREGARVGEEVGARVGAQVGAKMGA